MRRSQITRYLACCGSHRTPSNDKKKRLRQKGTSPLSLILDGFEGIAKLPLETGWWFKYDCFPILAVYVIVECHSWRGFSTFPRSNVRTRQKGPSPLLLILAGF